MSIMESRLIECFVTHVETEGPMLKIWAQLDRKVPTYIEKGILQLAVQFENNFNLITDPSTLRVHQLCCAKYSDGSYYRARITSLAKLSAGEVTVQFADYGNLEVMPLSNLRKLDGVVSTMSSLPDQAADFYLAGVYPRVGEWSKELLGFIREVICYSDLGFLHVGELDVSGVKKNFIQLMFEHQDFASILIAKNMGFAILVDTQKQLVQSLLEKKPLPPLTLWPPFNPSEPPPVAQMMVPSALANAAQVAVQESFERRVPQQGGGVGLGPESQSQTSNQGFMGRPSAQRRLLQPRPTYPDPGYAAPVPYQQPVERDYQSSSAQMRLEQIRQQQYEPVNQNQMGMTPIRSVQHPVYDNHSLVNNAPVRMQQPVEQQYGAQTHSQPLATERHYARPGPSPPTVQPCRPTTPGRAGSKADAGNGGFQLTKDEGLSLAHVFQNQILEIGSEHVVFISYANDGPSGFAAQLSEFEETLGKLLDDINQDEPSALTQPLLPGSTCLARYTVDHTLCRAVVMSVHSSTCHVYYVDFGNSEELPYSAIFELPRCFVIEPHIMAVRFTLSGLGNMAITKQVKKLFSALVNNKQFLLRVVPPEGPPLRQYGILFDEGRSVLDILKEKLKSVQMCYCPIPIPDSGSKEMVAVAYVESPGKFFVQKQENLIALETLMEAVAAHCEDAAQFSIDDIFEGLPCCSLYSGDGLWYRAQVKNITEEGIIVDYVDYGNTEPVQLDSLRKISPEIVNAIQSQAIACCLNKLQNVETSDELLDKFAALTDDKNLSMEIVGKLGDCRLVVELHDTLGPMPVNIGAALRAPKQQIQQRTHEHPAPAKAVKQVLPVAQNERKDLQAAVETSKSYEKPSWETRNEGKSNQRGGSRSNTEDWRQKTEDREERPNRGDRYDGNRGRDREEKGSHHGADSEDRGGNRYGSDREERGGNRYGGDKERGGNRYGGDKEERGGNRYGGDKEERGGDRYGGDKEERGGNRYGGDKEESGGNRYGGDKEERGGNRYGGDRDDKRGNRYGEDKEERGGNRFGGDNDKRGNRFGGDREDKGGNRFGGDREDRGGNRFGGDREDKGGNRFGGDRKERQPRDKGDSWGGNDNKTDTWQRSSESNAVVETIQIFATPDQRFVDEIIEPQTTLDVTVTWFINPQQFFVQSTSKQGDIEKLMNDIQTAYWGKPANVKDINVGSPVIAKYVADKVLYRAEVTEVKDFSYIVRYVDFGNCDIVRKVDMWQIESRFLDLPKQALVCSLSNVEPVDAEWSKNQAEIDKLFQDSSYQCTFHEQLEGKHKVTLMHNESSVADELVSKGLACAENVGTAVFSIKVPIEKEFYNGQTLLGHITYVEGVAKFYAHFDVDEANSVQALVDEHVQNLESITPLPPNEIFVDQLCIATADSTQWYRAKIVEAAETEGVYYITFLDYGDGDEVAVDKMIALPEQLNLPAHPAQATEMFLTGSDAAEVEPETEDLFKANLETTECVIHVDSVEGERLNVSVFSLDGQKLELVKHIGDELQQVEPLLPHPILAQKVSVFVSHIDDPSSVWLQEAKSSNTLAELLDRLYAYYEEGGEGVDIVPEVNSLCAAKSANDDQWYRARVLAISEDGIQVVFIDYGNGEVIPVENVKALDSSLYTPHALAFNISLPIVVTSELESDVLTEMTTEVEYVAIFHRDDEDKWYSELVNKKETLTDKLVELGFAEPMEDYPFTSYVEDLMRLPKLVPGMQVSMYISHTDSPGQFWIQREDTVSELEELQASLQDAVDSFEVMTDLACDNTLCAALFSEDSLWYRATVLEVNDSSVTVRFVDYGNTDVIDVASNPLKILPPRLANIGKYAIQCGLNVLPIDTEFSDEAKQAFDTLVAETGGPFLVEVVAERDILIIDIFLGDKSFAASLIADDLVLEFVEENSVYISHAKSPSEFWVQVERSTKRLELISDRMSEAAEFEPLQDAAEGSICAALFVDDEQWYRALVIAKNEDGTVVDFIDFGNSATTVELRALPEDLATILPLAKRCSLPPPDNNVEWCEEATEKFVELAAEGATLFLMEYLSEENTGLVSLTLNGKNVRELLLSITSGKKPETCTVKEDQIKGNLPETGTEEMVDEIQETVIESPPVTNAKEKVDEIQDALGESLLETHIEKKDYFEETVESLPETCVEETEDKFEDTVESLAVTYVENMSEETQTVEDETGKLDLTLKSSKDVEETQDETREEIVVLPETEEDKTVKPLVDYPMGELEPTLPDVVRPISPNLLQNLTKTPSRPMTPRDHSNKIVPGSISRGASSEELHLIPNLRGISLGRSEEDLPKTPSRSSSRPTTPRNRSEKIVPGSISRGVSEEELCEIMSCPIGSKLEHSKTFLPDSEGLLEKIPEVAQSCPATPITKSEHQIQRASSCEIVRPSPRMLKHSERIVPGCISRGESTEEMEQTSQEEEITMAAEVGKVVNGSDTGSNVA